MNVLLKDYFKHTPIIKRLIMTFFHVHIILNTTKQTKRNDPLVDLYINQLVNLSNYSNYQEYRDEGIMK